MNRRQILRSAVVTAGMTGLGFGGWWALDSQRRLSLMANCQSDNLSTVAKHLQEYANRHNGHLPPAAELLAVSRGEHEDYLWYRRAGLPYQWDLRLAGSLVSFAEGRPVAWCPPGGHGRYVGAIVIRGGELKAVGMTLEELRRRVERSP